MRRAADTCACVGNVRFPATRRSPSTPLSVRQQLHSQAPISLFITTRLHLDRRTFFGAGLPHFIGLVSRVGSRRIPAENPRRPATASVGYRSHKARVCHQMCGTDEVQATRTSAESLVKHTSASRTRSSRTRGRPQVRFREAPPRIRELEGTDGRIAVVGSRS